MFQNWNKWINVGARRSVFSNNSNKQPWSSVSNPGGCDAPLLKEAEQKNPDSRKVMTVTAEPWRAAEQTQENTIFMTSICNDIKMQHPTSREGMFETVWSSALSARGLRILLSNPVSTVGPSNTDTWSSYWSVKWPALIFISFFVSHFPCRVKHCKI